MIQSKTLASRWVEGCIDCPCVTCPIIKRPCMCCSIVINRAWRETTHWLSLLQPSAKPTQLVNRLSPRINQRRFYSCKPAVFFLTSSGRSEKCSWLQRLCKSGLQLSCASCKSCMHTTVHVYWREWMQSSLVPRLLFTEWENSLVNCLWSFRSKILKSPWRHVNWIVKSKML